jgi:hypothetical protein
MKLTVRRFDSPDETVAAIRMDDGTEVIVGPGDLFSVPAGHDSWVVGEEPYVSIHLFGAGSYASEARAR